MRAKSKCTNCDKTIEARSQKKNQTYGFAGLLHHNLVVRERHEDELLHCAFLLTDHITVEGVLCNGSCITKPDSAWIACKLKQSQLIFIRDLGKCLCYLRMHCAFPWVAGECCGCREG